MGRNLECSRDDEESGRPLSRSDQRLEVPVGGNNWQNS